jgi:Reverse transcriptase (RNA-dependent DNA polymerase)/GAG-pre-integrase domain
MPKPQCECTYPDIDLSFQKHPVHDNGANPCTFRPFLDPDQHDNVFLPKPRHPKRRPRPRSQPVYRPVPSSHPAHGPGNLEWTRQQFQTAVLHQALVFDVLATDTLLRMALQAPLKFATSMGNTEKVYKIIWDSGCSISVSHDKSDFVGELQPPPLYIKLTGLAKGLKIDGVGHVAWSVLDTKGMLRTLKLPAYYVPKSPVRLLSTTSFLQTHSPETIHMEEHQLTVSGVPGDFTRGSVTVRVDPTNNLPTCQVYSNPDSEKAIEALSATLSVVSNANMNLSEPEKELLRWHHRLGHLSFRKIQFLMRSGVLANTKANRRLHTAACQLSSPPKCAACMYGKQTRRPASGKVTAVVKDKDGALKRDDLFPGQRIAVDHFVCSTRGRLFTSRGKTSESEMFSGGCMFVDHASGYLHVEFQTNLNTHETINAKDNFELMCRDNGVIPQAYVSDNGSAFTSAAFTAKLRQFAQIIRFAGAGAHHHNGTAERAIQTIMSMARTMMLHASIHWPEMSDPSLWPMAVAHAVFLYNHVPNLDSGVSPCDLFTKTRWEQRKFHDLHVWGCPVYVLDKTLSDGKKLPRWKPRSKRTIHMGSSPMHASTVPLILNPDSGAITAAYHVVFDDWFATVSMSEPPTLDSDEWTYLFGDSMYQYVFEDDAADGADLSLASDQPPPSHRDVVARAIDASSPALPLRVEPPPLLPSQNDAPAAMPPTPPVVPPVATPDDDWIVVDTIRHHGQSRMSDRRDTLPPQSISSPRELTSPPPPPPPTPVPTRQLHHRRERKPSDDTSSNVTTRSQAATIRLTRSSTASLPTRQPRFGYDGTQGHGYVAVPFVLPPPGIDQLTQQPQVHMLQHFEHRLVPTMFLDSGCATPAAYKASVSDPDTLTYDQAMADLEYVKEWCEAAQKEISTLESLGSWDEVDVSDAKSRIIPGTWVFRVKRTPDGDIKKRKARFCCRGDLQEDDFETFAPVVSWTSVRLFLVLTTILSWTTCNIDFSSAFLQADLPSPIWVHLPRGFKSKLPGKTCLRLKRSQYGLTVAPRLWYQHLITALQELGLTQSNLDPCLLYKKDLLVIVYVDDVGVAAPRDDLLDKFVSDLKSKGFELTREGSFSEFLGIKFEVDKAAGTITMTQKGLMKKIIAATGLEDCNPNRQPAAAAALGIDPDGEPYTEEWSYPSIVGMLLYLTTNTRPDLAFAVSQVARFNHNPKQSHARALKMIVRYLSGTKDKGMIIKPNGTLSLDDWVDADFCGLFRRDPDDSPSSVKSRGAFLITLSDVPLIWKTQLHSEITLSTTEAEYSTLSTSLRTLLPVRDLLIEVTTAIGVSPSLRATLHCRAFQDNRASWQLATQQRLTNRTKYFLVKYHWFWEHVYRDSNDDDNVKRFVKIEPCSTHVMRADILTKGLLGEKFEECRKMNQGW